MIATALSLTGLALTGGSVAAYAAYTLADVQSLRGPLLSIRKASVLAGVASATAGLALSPLNPLTSVGFAVTAALAGYATGRQWLFPRAAPRYRPVMSSRGDGLVLVLPDGRGTRLRWLAHDRVARIDGWLLVHCGLARSVAIYDDPGGDPRAVLPHATGFLIAESGQLYDGVDGTPVTTTHDPLTQLPCRLAAGERFAGVLVGPSKPQGTDRLRTPRVPGARAITDPMAFGAVRGAEWRPLGSFSDDAVIEGDYFLSRWAAQARGLIG